MISKLTLLSSILLASATEDVSLYLYNKDQAVRFDRYLRVGSSFSPKSVGWVVEAKEGLSLPIFHNVTFEAICFGGASGPAPYDVFNIQNVNRTNLTSTYITGGGNTLDILDLNSHY